MHHRSNRSVLQRLGRSHVTGLAALVLLVASGLPAAVAQEDIESASDDTLLVIGDLMWSTAINEENTIWRTASRYCRGQDWGGHTNWRLPTLSELESLREPSSAETYKIREPFELSSCCAWSRTSLEDLAAPESEMDALLDEPWQYAWGLMFDTGIRYYSGRHQPDGQAICVRDVDSEAGDG